MRPTAPVELRSPRCVLRDWRDADLEPFARLNADPQVMEHFPALLSRAESDALAARLRAGIAERGWGFFALEVPGVAPFVGFVGLQPVAFEAHFTPCVEIGWRLDVPYWGKGYAREAARIAIEFAFETLGLDEVVAQTTTTNLRSMAVMEALGMTRSPEDDFDHPRLLDVPRLRRCVLYRRRRPAQDFSLPS